MRNSKQAPSEGGATFPLRHRIFRGLWNIVWLLFCAWTPRQLWRWRRFILRIFGAHMGERSDVRGSARVWYPPNLNMADSSLIAEGVLCYNPAPVHLERGALVSQRAHLCTASHDIRDIGFPMVARSITLGERCWIASEAFVGPGVFVGEGAVLGARAVAFRDLEAWTVYGGNPARPIRQRQPLSDHGPTAIL